MTGGSRTDAGRAPQGVLGLPEQVTAGLFDLDGVLTDTAAVHDKAWKEMFDAFLRERAERTGEPFVAFDSVADYSAYVDGKPRADGVRTSWAVAASRCPRAAPTTAPPPRPSTAWGPQEPGAAAADPP